jgi:hypothetical protein
VGAGGRIGRVEHAWLRARPRDAAGARPLPFGAERAPALSAAEASVWEDIVSAFTRSA